MVSASAGVGVERVSKAGAFADESACDASTESGTGGSRTGASMGSNAGGCSDDGVVSGSGVLVSPGSCGPPPIARRTRKDENGANNVEMQHFQ